VAVDDFAQGIERDEVGEVGNVSRSAAWKVLESNIYKLTSKIQTFITSVAVTIKPKFFHFKWILL